MPEGNHAIDPRFGEIVRHTILTIKKRQIGFMARAFTIGFVLFVTVCGGSAGARRASSAQTAPSHTDPTRQLTVERIYGEPSLSGSPTTGIEWSPDSKRISYLVRGPQGSNTGTELWTMDAATGERKVLVNSETLKTITHPEKTKSTQATGLGRVEPGSYFWSPAGDSLLFAGSNSLVLLDLKTMAPTAARQRRPRYRRSKIFARRQVGKLRP